MGVLLLSLADHRAARGTCPRTTPGGAGTSPSPGRCSRRLWETPAAQVSPPRLVTGDDLMRELGLPAGPAVGRALEAIREAQAQGEVSTRAEALALAREMTGGAAESLRLPT